MNKILKRVVVSGLALAMTLPVLAGCKMSTRVDSDTIKIMLSGQEPTGWDKVVEEYNNNGAKETGVKISVEWVSPGDYKEKLNLRMIGSENYDLVFDAPFNNLKTYAAK